MEVRKGKESSDSSSYCTVDYSTLWINNLNNEREVKRIAIEEAEKEKKGKRRIQRSFKGSQILTNKGEQFSSSIRRRLIP